MGRTNLLMLIALVAVVTVCSYPGKANESPINRRSYEKQGVVWDVRTDRKVIALTFDDGPNPNYTPKILDLLKEYQARATFFVTGTQVKKYPQIAKRQVLEGHELGNHTYGHPKMSALGAQQIVKELIRTEQAIVAATGKQPPRLFRPPGGYLDPVLVTGARQAGYTTVLWSFHQDTQDWNRPGVSKIVNKVVHSARRGDIVLLHDHGGNRSQTVRALKRILPELQKRGYRFVTVSELLHEKEIKEIYNIHFMEEKNHSPS